MGAPSKLTAEQALVIREAYARREFGAGITTLAARYGVSKPLICQVLKGTHAAARGLPDISGRRGNPFYGRNRDPSLGPRSGPSWNPDQQRA